MTSLELACRIAEPLLPPLRGLVRRRLRALAPAGARVLDVGGRRSRYTIGVPARVTITDVPPRSEVQRALDLGLEEAAMERVRRSRSNVEAVLHDDMTRSRLPNASFDVVVAVEVLEHVREDDAFVANVARVLRPGGTFLMTTPNGDFVENRNPDHHRHYRRAELLALLRRHFADASVTYAIAGGRFRRLGLRRWSLRRPVTTLLSMAGNAINRVQSSGTDVPARARGTHHLVAEARRA